MEAGFLIEPLALKADRAADGRAVVVGSAGAEVLAGHLAPKAGIGAPGDGFAVLREKLARGAEVIGGDVVERLADDFGQRAEGAGFVDPGLGPVPGDGAVGPSRVGLQVVNARIFTGGRNRRTTWAQQPPSTWERCVNLVIFGHFRRLLCIFITSSFDLYARSERRALTIRCESGEGSPPHDS